MEGNHITPSAAEPQPKSEDLAQSPQSPQRKLQ